MDAADVHALGTPAHKDKRLWLTVLFALIVIGNHRLGLALTFQDLALLGVTFNVFNVQSQFGVLQRLRSLTDGLPSASDSEPAPAAG